MISHTQTLPLTFRPTDVKILHLPDQKSLLFITDYDKSCIRVYDLNSRTLLSSLKTPSIPYYLEIFQNQVESGRNCEVYVSCRSNTVHKFTISIEDFNEENSTNQNHNIRKGMELCWTAGSPKEKFGDDKFYFPRGLVFVTDFNNNFENGKQLIVCNSGNNRIDCINVETGKVLKSFEVKFDRPVGISKNGNELFIVDHNNGLVQVLTLDGHFKRQFGTKGIELNCPRGICSIGKFCLITDNHRIQLFNSENGELLHSIGSLEKGKTNDQFSLPEGICFNEKTNEFLIADWENKRIQFFKLMI